MCGKNSVDGGLTSVSPGSPPRVREKHRDLETKGFCTRITPACAGKTNTRTNKTIISWDHPRVCGKNKTSQITKASRMGSPPRVREKLAVACVQSFATGITPACAGKTGESCLNAIENEDHPRVCGKNYDK